MTTAPSRAGGGPPSTTRSWPTCVPRAATISTLTPSSASPTWPRGWSAPRRQPAANGRPTSGFTRSSRPMDARRPGTRPRSLRESSAGWWPRRRGWEGGVLTRLPGRGRSARCVASLGAGSCSSTTTRSRSRSCARGWRRTHRSAIVPVAYERHEPDRVQSLAAQPVRGAPHANEVLATAAHRGHEPAALSQLGEERRRHLESRSGGDVDRVERSLIGEPAGPVTDDAGDVADAELLERRLRLAAQLWMALDRPHLRCQEREQRGVVARPGADVEHTIVA